VIGAARLVAELPVFHQTRLELVDGTRVEILVAEIDAELIW